MKKWIGALLFTGCVLSGKVSAQQNDIILRDFFQNKDYRKNWEKAEKCCPHSIKLLTGTEQVAGRNAVRFEVDRTDQKVNNGYRSELRMAKENTADIERWYKFSIFLPEDYEIDSTFEVLAQWHEVPDFSLGEKWRSAPISLQTDKDKWKICINSASDPVNTDKTISLKKTLELGDIKKGVWTDWLFHIRFSYQDDGVLEVWENKKMVADYKGPNYYNDKTGPFFKIGIYKTPWKFYRNNSIVTNRVIYFSDVKVGNEHASFNSMQD